VTPFLPYLLDPRVRIRQPGADSTSRLEGCCCSSQRVSTAKWATPANALLSLGLCAPPIFGPASQLCAPQQRRLQFCERAILVGTGTISGASRTYGLGASSRAFSARRPAMHA